MLNPRQFLCLMALGLLLISPGVATARTPFPPQTIARGKVPTAKVLFKPPANDRRPSRTVGAGSRGGQCPQDIATASTPAALENSLPLMALVPPSPNSDGLVVNFGLTMAARPTFWMYLPQTSAQKLVLTVQSEDASSHSEWVFPVPSTAGIVSLQPPADAPPLKIGENYQWAVVVMCGERPNPNDPSIAAWVQRVAPTQAIPQGTALDQAVWHGTQGLWYDMLTALGQELRSQPTNLDLTDTWANVLKSEGFGLVSMEPFHRK